MLMSREEGRRKESRQSLPEGKTEPWQFPYRYLFSTPSRLSVAWATNCFPSLPELVGTIFTTIPLSINKHYQLSQDTQPRRLGGDQASVDRGEAAPRCATQGLQPWGAPLGWQECVCTWDQVQWPKLGEGGTGSSGARQ